jgi:predicted secreted hydrolase
MKARRHPSRSLVPIVMALLVMAIASVGAGCSSSAGPPVGTASLDGGDAAPRDASPAAHDSAIEGGDAPDVDIPPSCRVTPKGRVSLPADDALHDEELEWWYWSGHLETAGGRWFGFEETFFAVRQSGVNGQEVDTALTDIAGGQFLYDVTDVIGLPKSIPNGFDLYVDGNTANGGNGHDVLHAVAEGASFDLTLDSVKAPVLQYGDGYVTYASGYSYYYSRELLDAKGTVVVGGEMLPVTGQAWFDHQWGELDQVVTDGWEWFAIQLDDGREMMLYVLLDDGQPTTPTGSFSDAECHVTYLAGSDVAVASTGTWTSPHTSCTYPMGWHVTYGDLDLTITPTLEDQELYSGMQKYWEGASTVTGSTTGRAYVELNGYCK